MGIVSNFLMNIRKIMKLHESMLKEICKQYHLTLIEATIISFLYNNPEKDTAADIVELRMLQKGNVSQAVETLYQKSLLSRRQDEKDRRKIHLSLTEKAAPIVQSMECLWKEFKEEIFQGISVEEQENFHNINERIFNNIKKVEEKSEKK